MAQAYIHKHPAFPNNESFSQSHGVISDNHYREMPGFLLRKNRHIFFYVQTRALHS